MRLWKGSGNECGNQDCSNVDAKNRELKECREKEINEVKGVPKIRACPKCHMLIYHT
jgi:hypothetical protein